MALIVCAMNSCDCNIVGSDGLGAHPDFMVAFTHVGTPGSGGWNFYRPSFEWQGDGIAIGAPEISVVSDVTTGGNIQAANVAANGVGLDINAKKVTYAIPL